MGMNYYVKIPKMRKCAACGNKHTCQKMIHIGKYSLGHRFRFAYNGGKYYKTIESLRQFLEQRKKVYSEDGCEIASDEFWQAVAKCDRFAQKDDCVGCGEMLIEDSIFIDGEFS